MGYLFLFLIFQIIVDFVCQTFIPVNNAFGLLAYCLVPSLIIAFVWSLIQTPRGYRKEFLKQPAFHKNMLSFFLVLFGIDVLFYFFI